MIEPEDVSRYGRELAAMTGKAAHDPAAFAAVQQLLTATDDRMLDAAARLRAQGFSAAELGRELGVTKATARERYGAVVRPAQIDAALRTARSIGLNTTRPGKLAVRRALPGPGRTWVEWWIVAKQGRLSGWWGPIRVLGTVEEAERFCEGMAAAIGWQWVKAPRDLREQESLESIR